ncbi:unnamed protein product [Leptidea sinapis]|uniref:MSP domain-containing protein n=1 Tax=Leptidea sinapis TaxID=189913 RepID=A0A5E4Q1R5_9NEOP|nr:unnamed protein product [Leptidea sinapis]
MQRRSIVMVNNGDKLYKFKWDEVDMIVVKPSFGFISPGEEKDLEVMFFSPQPITIKKTITLFEHNEETGVDQRYETAIEDTTLNNIPDTTDVINMIVVYSAMTDYANYSCELQDEMTLEDTFIYQTRTFSFKVINTGKVPMKIGWNFIIDDEFPSRVDKHLEPEEAEEMDLPRVSTADEDVNHKEEDRDSVDTWFEIDLPFLIEPSKQCLKPNEDCTFKVTFSPLDAFLYRVRLKSCIDNLDPYKQNISCKITAKSLIPYVHLDIEESDYLTSDKRKNTGVALPLNIMMVVTQNPELVPMHCNMLKGFVEGGTSTEVEFTFAPTAPGVYESQWKFRIPSHSIVINLLVAGIVREPDVVFVPTIYLIRNSLVGFTSTNTVMLKNNESEPLRFRFKGNSLCNESGKTPVVMQPEKGILKPRSETSIKVIYTPIQDGPLSFKIFCEIQYLTKDLMLCVNALSYSINPKISYYLIGCEHTASTYQRTIPFTIKNDGSATFFFEWDYSSSAVKKYLQVNVEPSNGHVSPGANVECTVYFTLKKVPVQSFPMTLSISDGPVYELLLFAEIEKPLYHFSCMDFDFGKCIVNAPPMTYKKNIAFEETLIAPGERLKISIYFRPKLVKEYEFMLHFWVNSLCEEIVTIKGEGVPLLFDLYEGCQKSFDLGPVKVGEKIIRVIEVMNHSKVQIEASFTFRDMVHMLEQYKSGKIQEQTTKDAENALSSLKVIPNKCIIKPYRKLNMKVFHDERPLVKLSGSATGMSLCLSQNSLQFGRVRKRGCKILKVMLQNKGDFGTRSDDMWLVLSELSNQSAPFETLKEFHVEPNSTFEIPVHFKPKTMGTHEAQVLYSPLGESALFVTLLGTAIHPNPNGTIYITVSAKDFHTEDLLVYNITEKIAPDKFSGYYEIQQPNLIKTWGEAAATCRWTFVCYEESEFNIKATLALTYSPLVVGESEEYLQIHNIHTGTYVYKIILKCLPAKEKCLEFSTPLGTVILLRLRVHNKSELATEFVAKVSHPSILTEKEYYLGPLEKGKFQAWFEPTELGVQHCTVSFNSPVAGEFVFNIKGIGTEPKPQGPYGIKKGGFTTIPFKNVFEEKRIFKIYVDREEFYVKTLYEQINSKEEKTIPVSLSETLYDMTEMPKGCLTIETYDPPEPKVQWTFFLQGLP